MNPNKFLREHGFGGRENFGEIARFAVQQIKQAEANHTQLEEVELLDLLEMHFGSATPKLQMNEKPRPYSVYQHPDLPFEEGTYDQIKTALRLPVALGGALMPDAHPGYSLPIGGVVALNHAVSPAFVGYDIACQMMLTIFDIPVDDFAAIEQNIILQGILASTSFGLGARTDHLDHTVMHDPLWNEIIRLKKYKMLAQSQLGSSGGGNHFCEVVLGENLEDDPVLGKKDQKWIGLLTHSGSRGIGNKLGHEYAELADQQTAGIARVPKGYGWLDIESEPGAEYLNVMKLMGEYARANHEIIHDRFLKNMMDWKQVTRFGNMHNYAWLKEGVVIHRKGATPADKDRLGLIPGSSGTPSYVTRGLGNMDSYESSSHGAGRPRSRTASKAQHDPELFAEHMKEMRITHYGVAPDETFMAYKNIDQVMDAQTDLVRPVARMLPKVVVMGGNVTSDDGD